MSGFKITIDGREADARADETVLGVARRIGVEIPTLCHLEKCGPLNSCQVCLVKVGADGNGKLVPACGTKVFPGMAVESETREVHDARRTALELLFSDHVGDCLSPCNRLCPLDFDIPGLVRRVQSGQLKEAAESIREHLPLGGVVARLCHHPCEQGCRRASLDDAVAIRDLEKVALDAFPSAGTQPGPRGKPGVRSKVAIVGAGPTGLAAAYYLAGKGYGVTVADRRERPGGSLRNVPANQLPAGVLDEEIVLLERLGVEFKTGIELGAQVTLDGLMRGFDAVLLAIGEISKAEAQKAGVILAGTGIQANPDTCQTGAPNIFAAGAAVKTVKQIVRALAEGRAAASCIDLFLRGKKVHRPEKPFSSVMGRIEPEELKKFACNACAAGRASLGEGSKAENKPLAATEALRCLHCDCASSGDCALQRYAQIYEADASRFKTKRLPFEQTVEVNGIVFEPGKCILCGICVRLTEIAGEPLGLAFSGRGSKTTIAAPFHERIGVAMQRSGEECVKHCPTGALTWRSQPGASGH
jgi:ferredoxin